MLLNQLTFCELKLKHAELDQFKNFIAAFLFDAWSV